MRSKLFSIPFLVLLTSFYSHSQSVYGFQFNFHNSIDSVTYHAFMLRNNDGSGLIRVRYQPTSADDDILIEMDTDEEYAIKATGLEDTTTLLIKAINPRFLIGDSKIKYNLPTFIFKYNPSNDFFEPSDVVCSGCGINIPPTKSFSWQLIEGEALNKDFVSQFFSEDEDLYKKIFQPLTRGLSPLEKTISLRLLIVADTLDESIGSACAKDIPRAVQLFKDLTDYLGIKYFTKIVCGKEYSKANVQATINALRPSSNDIVVFYYTGHGFRLPENSRPYPNLKLKNFKTLRSSFRDSLSWIKQSRKDNIMYSLNIEDIFNQIRKKGARFNLVLSDCCNNDIFSISAIGTKPGKTKGSGVEWNEDNIRTLFLNKNPMSVLATAAQSGQKSTCNPTFGGFFSYFFKESLESYCSKLQTSPTWDLILQSTMIQTTNKADHTYCDKPYIPENICRQTPAYKIVFGK